MLRSPRVAFLSGWSPSLRCIRTEAIAIWTLGNSDPDKVVKLDNLSFSRVAAPDRRYSRRRPLSDKTILVLSGDDLREAIVPADTMPLDQWGITAAPAANSALHLLFRR